jgi:heme/copper-type cytochrome/quinol oxidase subunit 2
VLVVFFACFGYYLSSASAHPQERYFNVTARQFAYEPGRIVVNKGDHVTIRLTSADVTHGLYIPELGVNETISYGEEKIINIVADKVGKFKIRCSVTCGPLHPFMVGEFVVEEGGINPFFIGSTTILILTGVLSFIIFSRRRAQVG